MRSLFILLFISFIFINSSQAEIIISKDVVYQGDIFTIVIKEDVKSLEGVFDGKRLIFYPSKDSYKAIAGVDLLKEEGIYPLEININGKRELFHIRVKRKDYGLQRLRLPENLVNLSPEDEVRVLNEKRMLDEIWLRESKRLWREGFVMPLKGKVITPFGLRRIINGVEKSPHTGVDISGEEGEEILSPNDGIVVFYGDLFFGGKSLVIDHGGGIYSMFFHLKSALVKEGEMVRRSQVIGLVGSTGRSTGPHLHWGMRVQGERVDPLKIIELDVE